MTVETFKEYAENQDLFWDCVGTKQFYKRVNEVSTKPKGLINIGAFFSKDSINSMNVDYKIITDYNKFIDDHNNWIVKKHEWCSADYKNAPVYNYLAYYYVELFNPNNDKSVYIFVFHVGDGLNMLNSFCKGLAVVSSSKRFYNNVISNSFNVMQGHFIFNGMHISFTVNATAFNKNVSINFKDDKRVNKSISIYALKLLMQDNQKIKEILVKCMNDLTGANCSKVTYLKYKYLCKSDF